jgi:hypothetical protein
MFFFKEKLDKRISGKNTFPAYSLFKYHL